MYQLRSYQSDAIARIRASYASGKRAPLFVLPTGGGKTLSFAYMAGNAAAKGRKVGVLVHRRELLEQARKTVSTAVGVYSVQSLAKRTAKTELDFIIIDEAHHATASTWRTILDAYPSAKVLGVTATPIRGDGSGLGQIFDDMILGPSMRWLIDNGYLVQPRIFAPSTVDLTGVRRRMGDYDKGEVESLVSVPSITGGAAEHYLRNASHPRALVFCVSRNHAEQVANDFYGAGIAAQRLDGTLSAEVRRGRLLDFAEGRIQVLTSVDLIGEGLDIPGVEMVIMLRPTQSLGLYLQQVGRALRPAPGKDHALIHDHVGNVYRHGFPDDDREWSLAGTTKINEASIRVMTCARCFAALRPTPTCPHCGYEFTADENKRGGRSLKVIEGELRELERQDAERIARERRQELWGAKTFEDFQRIERDRGYKPGWAHIRYSAAKNKKRGSR